MKKIITAIITITLLFAVGCTSAKAPQKGNEINQTPKQNESTAVDKGDTGRQSSTSDESSEKAGITKVKIFLIAIGDNGKSGKKVGGEDSAVSVEVTIEPTNAPLGAALNKLFSIKDRNYGQSGLYNVLYQSNLKLEKVTVDKSEAVIRLSGNLKLGGVMDNPRVKAQIEETALQFSTVKKVSVYLNDKTLDGALSLK